MSKLLFGLLLSVSIGSAYAAQKPEVVCDTFGKTKSATSAIADGVDKAKGNLSGEEAFKEFMSCPGSESSASDAIQEAVAKDPNSAEDIVKFAISKGVSASVAADAAAAAAPTKTAEIYAAAGLPAPGKREGGGLLGGVKAGDTPIIIGGATGSGNSGGGGGSGVCKNKAGAVTKC